MGATAEEEVCTSRKCYVAADWLKSFIDESVDPCEDFSAFTCNATKKKNLFDTRKMDDMNVVAVE